MKDRAFKIDTIAVFIFGLIVYLITCCRTVYVGDAGELATALSSGGIAHPPGYPLYTLIGYLWLKAWFFVRPIMAANILSAVFAAFSMVFLLAVLRRLNSAPKFQIINQALAALFGLSYPVWSQATHAEVYTLGAFLYLAALLLAVKNYQEPSRRNALMLSFLCGLVFTHHFSGGVILGAAALSIVLSGKFREQINLKVTALMTGCFLAPLSLYGYLLLRFDPSLPVNWLGSKTLISLWQLINGTIYQQYIGMPQFGDVGLFFNNLAGQLLWYGGPGILILGVPGLLWAFRNNGKLYGLFLLPALANLAMICCYHIPDFAGYLIPALVAIVIGLQYLLYRLFIETSKLRTWAINALALSLILFPLIWNFPACDLSEFTLGERYGKDLLDAVPRGGTLLTKSDNATHTTLYLRYVENYRPDVTVYGTTSTLNRMAINTGYDDFSKMTAQLESLPTTCRAKEYIISQGQFPTGSAVYSRGMVYADILNGDETPDIEEQIDNFISYSLKNYRTGSAYKSDQIFLEYCLHRIDVLLQAQNPEAFTCIDKLRVAGKDVTDPITCLGVAQFFLVRQLYGESHYWINLAAAEPQPSFIERESFVLLGSLFRRQGKLNDALQAFRVSLFISPEYIPARYNLLLVQSQLLIKRGDYLEAIDVYDSLLTIEPGNPMLVYNKARICEKLPGRVADAAECYRILINNPQGIPENILSTASARMKVLDGMMLGRE